MLILYILGFVVLAKKIWVKASKYWSKVIKSAGDTYENIGNGHGWNYVRYYDDRVTIGCQTVTRNELEFIARHYDWPTPEPKE